MRILMPSCVAHFGVDAFLPRFRVNVAARHGLVTKVFEGGGTPVFDLVIEY